MLKIEFSLARNLHRNWRSKMRFFLNGEDSLTEEEAYSPEACPFGKWLYSEGLPKYGDIPDMRKLERLHRRMHWLVKQNKQTRNTGVFFAAEKNFHKIEELSQEILYLLNTVEKQAISKDQ